MNKPFSIAYAELKQELTNLMNNSGLHPFVLESILQNYLYEVSEIARNQYRNDKIQYKKSLLEKKDEKKKD